MCVIVSAGTSFDASYERELKRTRSAVFHGNKQNHDECEYYLEKPAAYSGPHCERPPALTPITAPIPCGVRGEASEFSAL